MTPLTEVMRATAQEVSELGTIAGTLQDTLSPMRMPGSRDQPAAMGLQALDEMTQRLHGIAGFLTALASDLPAEWACDAHAAAGGVTLAGLALRLGSNGPAAALVDAGEVDLF